MADFDRVAERLSRGVARATSRRSLLAWVGGAITGAAVIPVLPVSRANAQGAHAGGNPAGRPPVTSGNMQDPGDRSQWR